MIRTWLSRLFTFHVVPGVTLQPPPEGLTVSRHGLAFWRILPAWVQARNEEAERNLLAKLRAWGMENVSRTEYMRSRWFRSPQVAIRWTFCQSWTRGWQIWIGRGGITEADIEMVVKVHRLFVFRFTVSGFMPYAWQPGAKKDEKVQTHEAAR